MLTIARRTVRHLKRGFSPRKETSCENNPSGERLTLPLILEDGYVPGLCQNIIYTMAAMLGLAILWASFGQIRELAVASGQVVPSGLIKSVHHLEGGQIDQIFVEEGQLVEVGQPILRLRPIAAASDLAQLQIRASNLQLQSKRLTRLIDGNGPEFLSSENVNSDHVKEQHRLYVAQRELAAKKRSTLEAQIAVVDAKISALAAEAKSKRRRVQIHKEQVAILTELVAKKLTTRRQFFETKSSYESVLADLIAIEGRLLEAKEELRRVKNQLQEWQTQLRRDHQSERAKISLELAELRREIDKWSDRVERLNVNATVRGVVQSLENGTPGEVIKPGALVAKIVPLDANVVAQVQLKPRDIGHIEKGDQAELKFSTFDPNVYGTLVGKVDKISPMTIQTETGEPYFKVSIAMDKNYLARGEQRHYIMPGMEVQANILTGAKSLMTYLLKPLDQSLRHAFSER